jgi:branched-chain amino acid transport system permease protein
LSHVAAIPFIQVAGGPPRLLKLSFGVLVLGLLLAFPFLVSSSYIKHIAILTLSYITLLLSYDLIVGRVGALSLAHVAFFGTGAYASSLVAINFGLSAIPRLVFTVAVALILAFLIGIPSFRLSYHSFAMGTLGFASIMLLVATNWVELTRGPLCLFAIPSLDFQLPLGLRWAPKGIDDYFFLELALALCTLGIAYRIASTRLGRTMKAVRENEVLAASLGTPVLRYKMFAFLVGAGLASLAGAVYSSYTTVTCPSEFAFYYTVNLLVMLFLGGRASIPGLILSAVLFTAIPEWLRVAESWRLVIYGVIVIVSVIYFPDGINRILDRISLALWPPMRATIKGTESRLVADMSLKTVSNENAHPMGVAFHINGSAGGKTAIPLLRIENLSKHFGGVAAVDKVSFEVNRGDIVGLIGPNGSGKTTLFNCVTGLVASESDSRTTFIGHNITNMRSDVIARLGLTRTFQDVRVFHELTVLENVLMAMQQYQEDSLLGRFLSGPSIARFEGEARARAEELLDLVGLSHHAQILARELSYGQRKLLIFAMAMMPRPSLVLLDEPTAAVNLTAIDHVKHYIRALNCQGITILIIEHNMEVIMDVCHRVIVLDNGRKIAEGSPEELQSNERVIDAYFGTA